MRMMRFGRSLPFADAIGWPRGSAAQSTPSHEPAIRKNAISLCVRHDPCSTGTSSRPREGEAAKSNPVAWQPPTEQVCCGYPSSSCNPRCLFEQHSQRPEAPRALRQVKSGFPTGTRGLGKATSDPPILCATLDAPALGRVPNPLRRPARRWR